MSTKDTNPKDAIGIAKVPYSTVPSEVIAEVGLAMMEGALKYGRHNFRSAGVRASVYHDAAKRHLDQFWEGQDTDPDSGLSHLVKAIACCVVLRDSQFRDNWVDDRPPKLSDDWIVEMNAKAAALLEKYPNPLPAYTELDTAEEPEPPPTTIDSLDDADVDYVWEDGACRWRWNGLWQYSSLDNSPTMGWLSWRATPAPDRGPFARAQLRAETY